jgi:hypothetical protein
LAEAIENNIEQLNLSIIQSVADCVNSLPPSRFTSGHSGDYLVDPEKFDS